jgi:hypothetical protein
LLGLLTPGHVGADLWRIKRLHDIGMPRGSAAAEVALDRLVGALGLAAFVGLAGAALPVRQLMVALGLAALLVVAVLLVRRARPHWIPRREWPPPRRLVGGLALSIGYQASIIALLLGALAANGHVITPLVVVGAFGASQLAGAVPGPNGASPRDVALVTRHRARRPRRPLDRRDRRGGAQGPARLGTRPAVGRWLPVARPPLAPCGFGRISGHIWSLSDVVGQRRGLLISGRAP